MISPDDDPHARVRFTAMVLFWIGLMMAGAGALVLGLVMLSVGAEVWLSVLVGLMLVVPGATYVALAAPIRQHKRWAFLAALATALLHLLAMIALTTLGACLMFGLEGGPPNVVCFATSIMAGCVILLAVLLRQLSKASSAIQYAPTMKLHGFEPVVPRAVEPLDDPDERGAR